MVAVDQGIVVVVQYFVAAAVLISRDRAHGSAEDVALAVAAADFVVEVEGIVAVLVGIAVVDLRSSQHSCAQFPYYP